MDTSRRDLLNNNAPNLFYSRSKVKVLEFNKAVSTQTQAQATSRVITTDADLLNWLGIHAPTNETKLSVTRDIASRILTYFQVMPSSIDFISVFTVHPGQQIEAVELRFKFPTLLQLCYNLKCVAFKYGSGRREYWLWSPRQAAVHHQLDVGEGTALWIFASARDELQERVSELTGPEGRLDDRTFDTPAESFISEEKTIYALHSSDFIPGADHISFIQKKEDETNKAIMMLNANAEILDSLEKFYTRLMKNAHFPLKDNDKSKVAIDDFSMQLQDYYQEFRMHASRAKTLGTARVLCDKYLQLT
ncbi:hypothetical protein WAI453_002573 [Rhynchosporium graminicola]